MRYPKPCSYPQSAQGHPMSCSFTGNTRRDYTRDTKSALRHQGYVRSRSSRSGIDLYPNKMAQATTDSET